MKNGIKKRLNIILVLVLFVIVTACSKLPPEEFRKLVFLDAGSNVCYKISDIIDFVPVKPNVKSTWEKTSENKWVYRMESFDPMSEQKAVVKFIFIRENSGQAGSYARIESYISNGVPTYEPRAITGARVLIGNWVAKGMQEKKVTPSACAK